MPSPPSFLLKLAVFLSVVVSSYAGQLVTKANGSEVENFNGSSSYAVPSPGQNGGWVEWDALAILEGQGEGAGNPPPNALASPDAKAEQSGAVWVPPASETFDFDAAGNRQSSALWDYGWDGRNKLVRARTKNHDASAQGYDITFGYDSEGRRFKKNVITYRNGAIASQDNITFIWDGWDMIYERHQNPSGLTTLERKYVWGEDIGGGAGGDSGAGGAGGLLLIRETRGTQTKDYYPLYDGSGHVIALADGNRTLVAEYAYGPFGELIHAKGPMAQINPIRYATKYYDSETGLYYFGQRYLDPVTGQWLNREPLGESESVNLYAYCHNDPVNRVDVLGMWPVNTQEEADIQRAKWLLMMVSDVGKSPVAPPSQFAPYFPEAGDFGLFKPFGPEDYKRAELMARSQGRPSVRMSSWEEADFASQPVMKPGLMPDVAAHALTTSLGGPYSLEMAQFNAGLLMPMGAGGMGLKFLAGEARALLPMLATGAKIETRLLAANRTPWTQVSSDARAILRDVEGQTGMSIPSNQRSLLADQVRAVDHTVPVSDAQYRALQAEYRSSRSSMIGDWEASTGQVWTSGSQAHHIIPTRYGGPNQWWNIHPAQGSVHQGGIHGIGSPTQSVFPTPVPR